jgi:hypothetical protein
MYMRIARICEEYTSSAQMMMADPNAVASDTALAQITGQLETILTICKRMYLSVSTRSMERVLAEFRKSNPTMALTKQRFLEWYSCFQSEVEGQIYLLVLPHRVQYWNSDADQLRGVEVTRILETLQDFPDAIYDFTEAANCFAFERFTASVYHLMRVAEFGLVSVAHSAGVEQDKINKGWDGCIQGIESAIKKIGSTKPTTDWQDQIKKLSNLCSWFTTIQKGWRNPVSHIPRTYSEGQALALIMAVRTLFEYLSQQGFKQSAMPHTLPVDATE